VNLIVFHDVKPEEIFLATFTGKAALQLREGLRGLLGMVTSRTGRPYDISRMYVGTVHSLCQRMLQDRRFYPNRQRRCAPVLLDDLGQYFYLYKKTRWRKLLDGIDFGDEPEMSHGWVGGGAKDRRVGVSVVRVDGGGDSDCGGGIKAANGCCGTADSSELANSSLHS
jgi:hypothetical protein